MKQVRSISIENYRSIVDPVEVPLTSKITFIVGPKNAGKSSIFRALGILFNGEYSSLQPSDFGQRRNDIVVYEIELAISALKAAVSSKRNLAQHLSGLSDETTFKIRIGYNDKGFVAMEPTPSLFELVPRRYFDRDFSVDFDRASTSEENIRELISLIDPVAGLEKAILVPSLRFISEQNSGSQHFGQSSFPGECIEPGNLFDKIDELIHPEPDPDRNLEPKTALCEFIRYSLDCNSVDVMIPKSKNTIVVTIDGKGRPIGNLGTGIEQLLIIGAASFLFSGKQVFIEEPEIHFHPHTQKRMIRYLNENSPSQIFIATHSAAVLDSVDGNIVHLTNRQGQCRGSVVKSNGGKFRAVRDLGHSPSELIQANFVIWVEGPSDRIYLNHWIALKAPDLAEGTDYSFVFYGGKILSHHDFSDQGESDLLLALSIARQFAIVMDSDVKAEGGSISEVKKRVESQASDSGALAWITEGREIENYVPVGVLEVIKSSWDRVVVPTTRWDQVVDTNKVRLARAATALNWDEWPLDLKSRVEALVERIRAAK